MRFCSSFSATVLVLFISACATRQKETDVKAPTAAEIRQLAHDAYIYGLPIVDNLRVQYAFFVDRNNPEYKAPYNVLFNIPRVFTPNDKTIQTPNSDTPYSWVGLDLRTEPILFIIPPIGKDRYWSLQLIDLYTHNFDYLGSRTTGNNGGVYMIAGPNWKGEVPATVTKLIRCETEIASAQFRTQLFNPSDLDNVKHIQQQYQVKTLSAFTGTPAPKPAPPIEIPQPLTVPAQRSSLEFFNKLNFALTYCPPHPSETTLLTEFSRIGIGAGKVFDTTGFTNELLEAYRLGITDAWKDAAKLIDQGNKGIVTPGEIFGTREYLNNNYLYRMVAAFAGIYGNSKEEAMYPNYYVDKEGAPLNGKNRYTLRFPPGQLPPVNSFWSLTMYDGKDLLVDNPLNRYLLNSPMQKTFAKDPDGGTTFYIQHENPGKAKSANWLPAPPDAFRLVLRLYWPKKEALDGSWQQPPVTKIN